MLLFNQFKVAWNKSSNGIKVLTVLILAIIVLLVWGAIDSLIKGKLGLVAWDLFLIAWNVYNLKGFVDRANKKDENSLSNP